MAIQIWTEPRGDQNRLAGGRALADGVASLGNIGASLEKAIERKKQENADARRLEETYKGSEALQRVVGLSPAQLGGLSAKDKIAKVTGGIGRLEIDRRAQEDARREQEFQMQQKQGMAQIMDMEARTADRAAQGRVAGHMQRLLAPQTARQPGDFPLNAEAFDQRVTGRTGLSPAARALVEASATENAPLPPSVMDDLIKGGGGADSLFRPEELGRIRPTEYEGVGFMPTSRGGGQVVTNPNTPQRPGARVQPRVVVGTNPLTQEPQVTWTGSPEDFDRAFPHLAKPGAKAAAPTPPQFKKGDRVKQGNVIYEFDGKEWNATPP